MFGKRKRKEEKINSISDKELTRKNEVEPQTNDDVSEKDNNEVSDFPKIKTEILPKNSSINESNLVEICDSKLIAGIDNFISGLFSAGNSLVNVSNALQVSGDKIYKVIIPSGARLSRSSSMRNAFRGIYQSANGKIAGHANLVEATQKGTPVLANSVAATMGIASMVVGQYYMAHINNKLEEISNEISKISDFQEDEFESSVRSLIALVKEISDFQIEIVEDNNTRQLRRNSLENHWAKCVQLLDQTCIHIRRYTDKSENIKFDDYEKELPDIQKWFIYQNALFEILNKISELRYTLSLGEMTREQCTSTLSLYSKEVTQSQTKLRKWHKNLCEQFKINIWSKQKKKTGVAYLPGIIKDDWKYKSINENTARMIIDQTTVRPQNYDTTDLFSEDVQLVVKDNKLYYVPSLPSTKDKHDDFQSMFEKYKVDE